MPRRPLLSHQELEVARRIREFRKGRRLSQEDWAQRCGCSRDLIAGIDLGRVRLLYRHAVALLPHLLPDHSRDLRPFNPLWIAEGTPPVLLQWPFLLPWPGAIRVTYKTSFLDFVSANRPLLASLVTCPESADLPEPWTGAYFRHWMTMHTQLSQMGHGVSFLGQVFERSAKLLLPGSPAVLDYLNYFHSHAQAGSEGLFSEKNPLTSVSENSKSIAMKPEMERLLDDVRKLTEEAGRKVKLAAELEVEPARVSEWLSGKYQPNGETTLRLLHWVAREKAQQKSPGSVISTASAKAQPGRKKHDNSRPSDPQKR